MKTEISTNSWFFSSPLGTGDESLLGGEGALPFDPLLQALFAEGAVPAPEDAPNNPAGLLAANLVEIAPQVPSAEALATPDQPKPVAVHPLLTLALLAPALRPEPIAVPIADEPDASSGEAGLSVEPVTTEPIPIDIDASSDESDTSPVPDEDEIAVDEYAAAMIAVPLTPQLVVQPSKHAARASKPSVDILAAASERSRAVFDVEGDAARAPRPARWETTAVEEYAPATEIPLVPLPRPGLSLQTPVPAAKTVSLDEPIPVAEGPALESSASMEPMPVLARPEAQTRVAEPMVNDTPEARPMVSDEPVRERHHHEESMTPSEAPEHARPEPVAPTTPHATMAAQRRASRSEPHEDAELELELENKAVEPQVVVAEPAHAAPRVTRPHEERPHEPVANRVESAVLSEDSSTGDAPVASGDQGAERDLASEDRDPGVSHVPGAQSRTADQEFELDDVEPASERVDREPGEPVVSSASERVNPDEPYKIRVEVDQDLTIEVSAQDGAVDVVLEGSREALTPLRDIGRELETALSQSGFSLDEFSMRENSESGSRGAERESANHAVPRAEREREAEPTQAPRRIRRGTHVDRIA